MVGLGSGFGLGPRVVLAFGPHTTLPLLSDLPAEHAAAPQRVLVVLFSVPGCAYCQLIRQSYLEPMSREAGDAGPVFREVVFTEGHPVVLWQGESSTHRQWARGLGVRVAPTLHFFGPQGQQLAAPLEGGDSSGLYGDVLARRLSDAQSALERYTSK